MITNEKIPRPTPSWPDNWGWIWAIVFLVAVFLYFRILLWMSRKREDRLRQRFGLYRHDAGIETDENLIEARRVFKGAADRLEGRYKESGPWKTPRIEFWPPGADAVITVAQPGQDAEKRRIVVALTRRRGFFLRLDVSPQSMTDRELRLKGLEDIRIGDPSFDRRYWIRGTTEPRAREFFTSQVKEALDRIRGPGPTAGVSLAIHSNVVRIDGPSTVQDESSLLHIVKEALVIFARVAALSDADGLMETVEVGAGDQPVCRVCGNPASRRAVGCVRCATPHHKDCWEFNKKCSTFGCGETKYV